MIKNETILKMRKIISVMTISAMLLSIAGASVLKANASIFPIDDNPNYISKDRSLDYTGLGMQFAMNKTVDLTGTGVDVTITDAERNSILEGVAKDAEEFVKEHQKKFYISILRDELEAISSTYRRTVITVNPDGTSTPETTDIRTIFGKCRNQDGEWMDADGDQPGNMPILIPKMVQEEDLFFGIVDTIYDKIAEIDNTFLGWDYYEDLAEEIYDTYIDSFDPRTSAKPAWVPDGVTRDDSKDFYNEIDKIIELKTQELYNNKINTLFVKKLGKQLDVKFSFALEELSATGAENNKFGVDGTKVKRGKLVSGKSQMPFSEVDFAADDHIYDEILNEDMNNILSGGEDNAKNNRDGRDVFTHSLIFDLGQLRSSDDSQYSYSENMERSLEDGWEGWHFLLEVGDSLTTYDVFWPLWSYVQTFNLHLNPAVMYTVDNVRADVITDAVFDDSGKLRLKRIVNLFIGDSSALRQHFFFKAFNEGSDFVLAFKNQIMELIVVFDVIFVVGPGGSVCVFHIDGTSKRPLEAVRRVVRGIVHFLIEHGLDLAVHGGINVQTAAVQQRIGIGFTVA